MCPTQVLTFTSGNTNKTHAVIILIYMTTDASIGQTHHLSFSTPPRDESRTEINSTNRFVTFARQPIETTDVGFR